MRLLTETASPGDWVMVEGIDPANLNVVHITIGPQKGAAYIEGTKALIRCPKLPAGKVKVSVGGIDLGKLVVQP